jgi:hypothetical protein
MDLPIPQTSCGWNHEGCGFSVWFFLPSLSFLWHKGIVECIMLFTAK